MIAGRLLCCVARTHGLNEYQGLFSHLSLALRELLCKAYAGPCMALWTATGSQAQAAVFKMCKQIDMQ